MDAYEIVRVFLTEGWAAGKPSPERQKAIEALGSIRAEARAEALLKAAERAVAWYRKGQIIPAHINSYAIKELRATILADEPKEPCSKCAERKGATPCEFCGPPAWDAYQDGGEVESMIREAAADRVRAALLSAPRDGMTRAYAASLAVDAVRGRDVVERKLKEAEE